MADKIRVLHVLDQLTNASGVASVVMGYVRHIDAAKVTLDVAVYLDSDPALVKEVRRQGGQFYQLPDIKPPFGTPYHKAFTALLRQNQYKFIHGHVANSAFIYMREAKRQGVAHRIIHAHSVRGADILLKRLRNGILNANICRWANHYLACSAQAAKFLFGRHAGEAVCLPNTIDTQRFRYRPDVRAEVRAAWNVPQDAFCIGHVGRFAPVKNHEFLLGAFAAFKANNAVLVLVGDGPLEADIKAKVQAMGLQDRVRFLGARGDPERTYQGFDVFWQPSLFEGFSIAALEAQCAGLPCVLSDSIPKDALCGNYTQLPLDQPSRWGEASLTLLEGYHRQDGRQLLWDNGFDITQQAALLPELYRSFLDVAKG